MAAPTRYNPATDFSDYQASNPGDPLQGSSVDIELAALEITTDDIIDNLGLIQRDDGKLENLAVHPDALSAATLALITAGGNPRGAWETSVIYAVGDIVDKGSVYICLVEHTSGTFSTDLAAGKWMLFTSSETRYAYVEDYRQPGDTDREVWQRCFNDVPNFSIIVADPGRTYTFTDDAEGDAFAIATDKSLTVLAHGATFKMGEETGYNAIRIERSTPGSGARLQYVAWYGGIFDGNKNQQDHPQATGDPSNTLSGADDSWDSDQGNRGLLTIEGADVAIISDVVIKDSVADGANFIDCTAAFFGRCSATGGVPLAFSTDGQQATYFKYRYNTSDPFRVSWNNIYTEDGSIGVHVSGGSTPPDPSVAVGSNIDIRDAAQNAYHFEQCLDIHLSQIRADAPTSGRAADVHIGTATKRAIINGFRLNSADASAEIDFNAASALEYGLVANGSVNTTHATKPAIGPCHEVKNCKAVNNSSTGRGVQADKISSCSVTAGDSATWAVNSFTVTAPFIVDACDITGGSAIVRARATAGNWITSSKLTGTANSNQGILNNGGDCHVADTEIANTQQNAVNTQGGAGAVLSVHGGKISNFGQDTGAASNRRHAIGGDTDGDTDFIIVKGVMFDDDGFDKILRQQGTNKTECRFSDNILNGSFSSVVDSGAAQVVVNGLGVESANAETPTASKWQAGDIVEFTDSGDASGDGTYILGTDGSTWTKIG